MTTVSICCTISLEAHEVYALHSARREGSSMVNEAILFFDEFGPRSKESLARTVQQREKSIAFLQDYILTLGEELKAMQSDSNPTGGLRFDEDTGLFRLGP